MSALRNQISMFHINKHLMPKRRNVLIILFLASCSSIPKEPASLDKFYVTETGFENGGEFCSDFSMSAEDVSAFFSRAEIIDHARLHANFDYLPCYIRGRAMLGGSNVTWEIRAGGTGKLLMLDGQASLYGCSTCNDLFGGRN
jgi:hypothetical protein